MLEVLSHYIFHCRKENSNDISKFEYMFIVKFRISLGLNIVANGEEKNPHRRKSSFCLNIDKKTTSLRPVYSI